jgi:hypothetical protein
MHQHYQPAKRRGSGLMTELRVGEQLTFRARHGTGELTFTLDGKDVEQFLGSAPVDSVQIALTISRRDGQRACVQVRADEAVKVVCPSKDTASA